MPTTALPRGRASKLRLGWESAYGTSPGGNFNEINTYSHDFQRSRPLDDDDILGAGFANSYDSRPPGPGLEEARGTLSVPADMTQLGYFLSGLLGRVSAAGTTPKTHTFGSGAGALPSLYIERELASGQFEAMAGAVVAGMTFGLGAAPGYRQFGVDLLGKKILEYYASTGGGTPTVEAISARIANSNATLKIATAAIGQFVSGQIKIMNDVSLDRFVGDSEFPSQAILEGQSCEITGTVRYSTDSIWRGYGNVGSGALPTTVRVDAEYIISANSKLVITLPAVSFEPVSVPVQNGKSMTAQVKGRAEVGASNAMVSMVLTNSHATY